MSTTKVKGFHISLDLIKFLEKFSKDIRFPESRIIEALIDHLQNLPEKEQKKIITEYLTKNL